MTARIFATGLALSALAMPVFAQSGAAQKYPTKPVRLLVGFAPGGGSDILARAVGQKLTERLGQSVVTDNRAGAGGIIAMDLARGSPPDGYTLLVISGSALTNATIFTKVDYDVRKALAPISQMSAQPYVMLAHPSVPVQNVKDLIAHARARKGGLNYGTSGTGSSGHLGMELFKSMVKVEMTHIPYKGSGAALIDLVAGQVQVTIASAVSSMPHAASGKVRALAVTSLNRSRFLPDLPSVSESGVPGYDVTGWYGLAAPPGTPAAIVNQLSRELNTILRLPDIQEKLAADGTEAVPSTPAELSKAISNEIDKWTRLVNTTGLKL
jgi:tripartite-type tricarboxylate transporter receptor subunit TctC